MNDDWRTQKPEIMPPSRVIGRSSIWRQNGTGTDAFYILWICVWWKNFAHSTTYLG